MRTEASVGLWREALDLFGRLVLLDDAAQAQHLAELSAARPELHAQVQALLQADRQAASRDGLAGSAAAEGLRLQSATVSGLTEGAQIGPYHVERRLGVGGMGEVWRAHRADQGPRSTVALKLLHAHLLQSTLRERFLREGQILGRLTHAGVARLLDAGVTDAGQPYLALEYIEGERIDSWCDGHLLELPARVRLFLQVCEAVAHAHAHLIVHRDLKPSNILVDDEGRVHLLDFGIAKLIEGEQPEAAETELTRLGGRALTPEYAAPEQVAGLTVTTATDVYSLGVLLYVLLSGRRPYGAPGATLPQLEREVLETEPPPPSQARAPRNERTAERAAAEITLSNLAERRGTTPRKLRQALRGDLDNIVMKALRKAPSERYPSVLALAEDLRRYLDHRPVLAQADSFVYRAGKFARRHRISLAAASIAMLAVVIGVGGVVWQARVAAAESQRAERVTEFLISVFEQADPGHSQGRTITARSLVEQGLKQIGSQLQHEPAVQADLYDALARIYAGLGDDEHALELAQNALSLSRAEFGARDLRVGRSLHTFGSIQAERRQTGPAREALEQAARIAERAQGADSLELARIRRDLAMVYVALGRDAQAVELQRSAHAAFRRALGEQNPETAEQLFDLAQRLEEAGNYTEAEQDYRQSLAALSASLGPEHSKVALAHRELGGLLDRLGRSDEADRELSLAIAILHKVYGERHPEVAAALFSHALLLMAQRRLPEADAALQETLRIYAPDSYLAAQSRRYLGNSLILQERYTEAEAQLAAAAATFRQLGGPDEVQQYRALADLATAKLRRGAAAAAEPLLRESVRELERLVGPDSYEVRNPLKRLGETLLELQRPQEALAVLKRTRVLELKLLGSEEHRDLASTEYLLARALYAPGTQQDPDAARRFAEHAVALNRAHYPGVELGRALLLRGRLELASGERQAAREDFIAAHAEFQRSRGDGYPLSRQALALEQQAQGG